jgi:hypothetical protein
MSVLLIRLLIDIRKKIDRGRRRVKMFLLFLLLGLRSVSDVSVSIIVIITRVKVRVMVISTIAGIAAISIISNCNSNKLKNV